MINSVSQNRIIAATEPQRQAPHFSSIKLFESIPPPEITPEQSPKGGFALRKLKKYCEDVHEVNKRYVDECNNLNVEISRMKEASLNMERTFY
jgi:hypothetical protein